MTMTVRALTDRQTRELMSLPVGANSESQGYEFKSGLELAISKDFFQRQLACKLAIPIFVI